MIPRTLSILVVAGALAFAAGGDKNNQSEPQGRTRVRFGGVTVGAGYARYSGYYPFYPYNFGYYSAAWSPYYCRLSGITTRRCTIPASTPDT
jgi:hypothetical protein